MKKYIKISTIIFICNFLQTNAQITPINQTINDLVNDAIFYTEQYISPASDAAIYQASSGWITSTKKKNLGEVVLGINANLFFVPKSDRKFTINNNQLNFFNINGYESIEAPTALGDDTQYVITGDFSGTQITLKTPEGINDEKVFYSYLQGGVGLWYGTELLVKYSPKIKLKKGDYQVFGAGLKHNIDQYFSSDLNKSIHVSGLIAYSIEKLSADFIEIQSSFGGVNFNSLNTDVETYQTQLNISKTFKKLETIFGLIYNISTIKYNAEIYSDNPTLTEPISNAINDRLIDLGDKKNNLIGELSGRYQFNKFYLQGTIGFGKFINTNLSLQYEF